MEVTSESTIYEFDTFRIDGGKRLFWNLGEPSPLTSKAFDTLFFLVQNAGKTVSKDELMSAVWPDTIVEENNLNKTISVVRRSLGERPGEHRFIATVPGNGYKFVALVKLIAPNDEANSDADLLGKAAADEPGEPEKVGGRPQRHSRTGRKWAVPLLAVIAFAIVTVVWLGRRTPNSEPIRSIAVLPFRPVTTGGNNEVMGFGMADSLIAHLSKSDNLIVRPLSATRRYVSDDNDAVDVGRSLRVDAVLEGTVQTADNRIRITARLMRTADGKQLWAGNFDEQMRDVFAVQDSITERVAAVLDTKLGARARKRYTDNVESYQLYLLGQYTAMKLTPQDHFKAVEYFRRAIQKDPNYALAYAGITGTYLTYMMASDASPSGTLQEAKAAAARAVELDDELPEAHVVLGRVALFYDWNWGEAERQLLRAYDLDPNDTECLLFLGHFYSLMGKHQKALELIHRATQLDPITVNRGANEGQFLYYAGLDDEAMNLLKERIELNPNHWLPRMFIARVYIEKGMYREAIAECDRAKELGAPSLELVALAGESHAKLGEVEKARAALTELEKISQTRYVPPYFAALIHNALGEKDATLALLEKGLDVRDVRMTFLKVDPRWKNLRSDPQFVAIMKQMKFE